MRAREQQRDGTNRTMNSERTVCANANGYSGQGPMLSFKASMTIFLRAYFGMLEQ